MAEPSVASEQLMELLLTLKKTTPAAARTILNSQPAIAYALITLMVSMNAINIEVFQRTLAEFGASGGSAGPVAAPIPTVAPPAAPIPALPPHLQQHNSYRNATPPSNVPLQQYPPSHTPTPPYGYTNGKQPQPYNTPPPNQSQYNSGYTYPAQPSSSSYPPPSTYASGPSQVATPALPDALAHIPDDQKALIARVLSMTPDQINTLPPTERNMYIQIRTTLGLPPG